MKFMNISQLAFICLAVSACGGGSSGPSVPTDSTGEETQEETPPSIVLKIAKTDLFEGEAFEINAEDTTAASISIIQTSGPAVQVLDNISAVHFQFRAPEFDYDTVATIGFEVVATKTSGVSSTKNIEFTVKGYSGPGRVVAEFESRLDLVVGNYIAQLGFISKNGFPNVMAIETNDDQKKLVFLGGAGDVRDYSLTDSPVMEHRLDEISSIKVDKLAFNLRPVFADEFSVIQEDKNTIQWFTSNQNSHDFKYYVEYRDEISIENPCDWTTRYRVFNRQAGSCQGERCRCRLSRHSDTNSRCRSLFVPYLSHGTALWH
jgi:hypothetical protein